MPSQLDIARIAQLVGHYRPAKWRVTQKKGFAKDAEGACCYATKTLFVPPVIDDYSFFVYLHEVAHAVLHRNSEQPSYIDEFEAERWAMEKFREIGVRVTREILKQAKNNVFSHIRRHWKTNDVVRPDIWKWVDPGAPKRDRARYLRRR